MKRDSLSERMLIENTDVFSRMVDHRFVRDIRADRLPREVLDRYLVIEGAFVDTAISILALATARAMEMETRRRLIAMLDALANEQIAYFERVFAARGISPTSVELSASGVAAFRDGMLHIATTGGHVDIATAMFPAEWIYWT